VRRVRRIADLSQRQLARHIGVSPSTVGRIEAGSIMPTLPTLERILATAGLRLAAVDAEDRLVPPLPDDDLRDGGGRHYPSHLDVIRDPGPTDWWGEQNGLAAPPVTFRRDRNRRDARRAPDQVRDPAPEATAVHKQYGPWPIGFRRRRRRPS
jgi:transcriptional regulator with XRE-family HTH domain